MNDDRIARMRVQLEQAFQPARLVITDQSHRHAGHAGARDGRGHFEIEIVAAAFQGKLPLARHRLVYAALGKLLETDIHAINIQARTPDETAF